MCISLDCPGTKVFDESVKSYNRYLVKKKVNKNLYIQIFEVLNYYILFIGIDNDIIELQITSNIYILNGNMKPK